jgi:hypothetical protein
LGDAFLSAKGEFDIQHGPKQFGYLLWLFKNLQPYFGEIRHVRTCRRIRSCAHKFGLDLRKEYYPKGKKIVSEEILSKLSPLSLAVWFMDDGQVLPSGKQARIATCAFSKEENELICEHFKNSWDIEAKVGNNGPYPQVIFNKENTLKLVDLIRIYVPLEMRYKIRPVSGTVFYLSGGMEFKKNLGAPWREWLTAQLEKLGHTTVDPVKLEAAVPGKKGDPLQEELVSLKLKGQVDRVREMVRMLLFRKDMYGIQLSDAVIVLYDKSAQLGAGTLSEAWESFREGRPVYLVTDFPLEKIPTWLIGETTSMFNDFEDLLRHVSDSSRVKADMLAARKARDEVLAGIY